MNNRPSDKAFETDRPGYRDVSSSESGAEDIAVRDARQADVAAVTALDRQITGIDKPDYWNRTFKRYGEHRNRWFLVAESEAKVIGFIIGEIRAWEFGSPPSGWVFAIGVDPESRLEGIGTLLFDTICARMKATGVRTVRTMLARDDALNMAFFRSQGMAGGSFIQLEMPLDWRNGQSR